MLPDTAAASRISDVSRPEEPALRPAEPDRGDKLAANFLSAVTIAAIYAFWL